jgi:uncharacterized protein with PQ loop repeat
MVRKAKNYFNIFHTTHVKPHHQNKKITQMIDTGVASIGIFSSAMAIPQVLKVYSTHNITSLSSVTWIAALMASIAWLMYGVFYKSKPILASSALSLTVNALMVVAFFVF